MDGAWTVVGSDKQVVSFIAAQAAPVCLNAGLAHNQTADQAALIGSTGKLSLALPLWRHAIAIPVTFLHDSVKCQVPGA